MFVAKTTTLNKIKNALHTFSPVLSLPLFLRALSLLLLLAYTIFMAVNISWHIQCVPVF